MSETKSAYTPPGNTKCVILEAIAIDDANLDQRHAENRGESRKESRRWWIKLVAPPLLLLLCGAILIAGLGLAQKIGLISSGGSVASQSSGEAANVNYICPMMCTPPQAEPGRCPVCAMELVPATSNGGTEDRLSVDISPAARRVANIQTVQVTSQPMSRTIRAVGEVSYDEGTMKTIAAYVDGRIEQLYADYTGVVVAEGDHLALLYSPRLYSSQVELLLSKRAMETSSTSTLQRVASANKELFSSARQRLAEMGLTEQQICHLEELGEATSRMHICAPTQGTVIEKLATEGQYVKEGQPIYKLADLSTVWLMLELFPEDAAAMRYGQKVDAVVQSLPSKTFSGRVAFIDPNVNPRTRTVGIRVVFSNTDGQLRIGDFAKATIHVAVMDPSDATSAIYDPELAHRWISPRHPHIVADSPGNCPLCGIGLVPAEKFGFVDEPSSQAKTCVIPRNAVLMAGGHSIVYVETRPGRFELRPVTLGPTVDNQIVILDGLQEGEFVAINGNFLIDSQMQLAGNPSLIDPTKGQSIDGFEFTAEMIAAFSELTAEDRKLAEQQRICPVTELPLGSMGAPIKVDIDGQPIFICCMGCEGSLRRDPEKYLAILGRTSGRPVTDPAIVAALGELTIADRELAVAQRLCPVADYPLGSMGTPIKVDVNGTPVFICCEGCRSSLLGDPEKYLAKLNSSATGPDSYGSDVPPIGAIEVLSEQGVAPPIGNLELIIEDTSPSSADSRSNNTATAGGDNEVVR